MLDRAVRVFLGDDHVVVRQGLRSLLEQKGFVVVGEAADGHAALQACARLRPDVAVLDVAMPLLNGIDAARELASACPDTRVVLLTMYANESYVLASLRAGVSAYVLKSSAASGLVEAIEAVVGGQTYMSPGVSGTVVQAYLSSAAPPRDPLSCRERQVLQLVAEGRNMKEIGGILGISARTAETHRARLMNKLDIHDVPGLVRHALTLGLISMEPASGPGVGPPLPRPATERLHADR